MLTLIGHQGGGQILRSALTLAMLTGRPFRLSGIRGARPKPGLARQHLTCVRAAAEVCQGAVDGADVARKETSALCQHLDWTEKAVFVESPENCESPGHVLAAEIRYGHLTERVSAFGAHGKTSQRVAHEVARMMNAYLDSGAVVGRHLADQLLLPMALSGGGKIHTAAPSNHVTTNREVIESFLPVRFSFEPGLRGCRFVSVEG